MPEPKTYVPKSSAKEVTFKDGGSIIKVSFHAAEVAKFLTDHANEKGYVTLGISKLRNPRLWDDGNVRETHCCWLDTWKPQPKAGSDQVPE